MSAHSYKCFGAPLIYNLQGENISAQCTNTFVHNIYFCACLFKLPEFLSTWRAIFSLFIKQVISILGIEVQQAQTAGMNLLAKSARVLRIQAGFGPYKKNEKYLPLYRAMIQGILVDDICTVSNSLHPLLMVILQITYMRFLYSMAPTINISLWPPASCICTVNGMFSAEVTGWVTKPVHIGFLMPMMILNFASLIILWISIGRTKRGSHSITVPLLLFIKVPLNMLHWWMAVNVITMTSQEEQEKKKAI